MGQTDHSSLDISEQLARWVIFLEQWEKALDTGKECVVMGDFNLDFLSFNRTDLASNSQAYRLRPLVDELFTRVVPHGVKQCMVGATRQGRAGLGRLTLVLTIFGPIFLEKCHKFTASIMAQTTR